ncbi:MAG: glycosyltransferase family 2 protein, partial [Anaerolineales bacterium]|nr:glycosyltransferase family 2 protein [Anaerolineales bacterium]
MGKIENNACLPLISVILPFYNAEKYLEEAVNSIIEQEYRNIEILLVDDKSTDSSLQLAEELRRKDSRIRVLRHKVNKGSGPARNAGVEKAGGEYVFFLDSDDILKQDALSILQEVASREGVAVVIGSCNQIDEDGFISDHDRSRDNDCEECFGLINGEEAVKRWLNIEPGSFLPVRPWGILIETGLYRRSGLDFSRGEHEDLTFTPFLYKFAGRVFYLRDIIATYRIRQGSIINTPFSVGRVRRYHSVWANTLRRLKIYGLEDYERDFKIFHIGNFLWQLNLSVSSRDVLEAAAELLQSGLKLGEEKRPDKYGRDLAYMPEMVSRILVHSGFEKDFEIWEKLVSGFGDAVIYGFVRRKLTEIRNMIWRVQMNENKDRETLLQIKAELAETENTDVQRDQEISGLKAENQRLRKRLMEVSFYLNAVLTDMDRRSTVSNEGLPGSTRVKEWPFRPSAFFRLVKRMPVVRNFIEAGIIRTIGDSGQFSPEFYRETYTDLAEFKGDLLLHFVRYGGREGRAPNCYFDSKWYF